MAQGNLSPRQRMINLMYLIFIAMLALNIDKAVISSFGTTDEKYETANGKLDENNDLAYKNLAVKASENNARYGASNAKAIAIKNLSKDLNDYLDSLKNVLKSTVADPSDYEMMDKPDYLDEAFFVGDKYTPAGQEYVDRINNYRNEVLGILGNDYPNLIDDVQERFKLGDENGKVEDREGRKVDWLDFHYKGFPLITSIMKMSGIQNDVKTTEEDVLSAMLKRELIGAVSMTNYTTLLEQPKGAWYQGETFSGSIVLGRKDASTRPARVELKVDGKDLRPDEYEIEDGRVVLQTSAGNPGDHKITGRLIFLEDGEEVPVKVEKTFSTIADNVAVISADKMNVVYRGVVNPMTISVSGIADNKVTAKAPGLDRVQGSKYLMRPGQGTEVTITASYIPSGETNAKTATSTFRIKDIPKPSGTIRGEIGEAKMSKRNLEISTVGAELEDFDFDIQLRVNSFKFKVPGQPTVEVSGSRLDDRAKRALRRAKRGETIQIFDIREEIVNNTTGYRLPNVTPVLVEITK